MGAAPRGRVVGAGIVGTTVEWYDSALHGSAAAPISDTLFFPEADAFVGTPAAFATHAVGFSARPVGVLAPVLLVVLWLVQGFALGGEWGGAVLIVSEHGRPGNRGSWSSWPQAGAPATVPAITIGLLFHGAVYGSQAAFFAELFGTEARYTGVSVDAQPASRVAGVPAPLIALALLGSSGEPRPGAVALHLVRAVVTLVAVMTYGEIRTRDLGADHAVEADRRRTSAGG